MVVIAVAALPASGSVMHNAGLSPASTSSAEIFFCSSLPKAMIAAMAPMFPFLIRNNDPVGIARDHRAYYAIMKRLKSMFKLDIDLAELMALGQTESEELRESLERIGESNPKAKELIVKARADYVVKPFEETVELDPELDKTLDEILRNMPDEPQEL